MWVNFVQVLLEQCLLSQDGVFDYELEQASNVVSIKMMCFAKLNESVQKVTFTVDITNRTMRKQFGFTNFYGQSTSLSQQGQLFFIQRADLIAQRQQWVFRCHSVAFLVINKKGPPLWEALLFVFAFFITRRNASHSGEGKKECEEERNKFHVIFLWLRQ